ncbi:cytochrome P450 [Stereum hirsutum FP-91666 SS1]|uniref:cytochrome P450 n=1 Tax=Stereum hirsutum (strain FP-91666) TaxID=721885 RepID=UPI000444A764|nr:cytochrome P450 [Stereum hirsutum FP-91666 SS1]EIM81916.1 cytochrome P450 [Stereum hirsutum FP-91666 SS1]
MSTSLVLDVLAPFVLLLVTFLITRSYTQKRHAYPPGPPGLPIIGNMLQLPTNKHWLQYDRWTKQYGDVIQISSLGEKTIILGSVEAANDLLDARGNIYSDRPPATMAGELVGWNLGLGYARFFPSTSSPTTTSPTNSSFPLHSQNRFRALRRFFHTSIGPRASLSPDLVLMQEQERTRLLGRLIEFGKRSVGKGGDVGDIIRQSTGALILLLTYGYRVNTDTGDPLVKIVEDAMLGFARASEPDAFWVDRLSILKHIPEWMPGASFQRKARLMREDREKLYDVPFDFVISQTNKNENLPSIVSTYLSAKSEDAEDVDAADLGGLQADAELIKAAAASLYSGADTPATLVTFLLAMVLNPEVQSRAHAELDALLGSPSSSGDSELHRLPTAKDRGQLSFVDAIVKEVWRWNPSVPLGLAHRVTQDDVYKGMFIEAGTTVYPNIWSMLHDPQTYPSPESFMPERFLDSSGHMKKLEKWEDPGWVAFGFGRRICPGMFLAENSIFTSIASLLYVFDILKAKDDNGTEIEPEVDYDGFICHAKPFPCRLVPRSKGVEALVMQELQDASS